MSMTTPLIEARRLLEQLTNRLPQPVLDRLLSLRRAFPHTPLKSLPEPVRHEVKQILTCLPAGKASTSATNAPQGTVNQPALPNGQGQIAPINSTTRPPLPRAPEYKSAPGLAAPLTSIIGTDQTTGRDVTIA